MIRISRHKLRNALALTLLVLSFVALFFAFVVTGAPGGTEQAAAHLEKRIERRMAVLDTLMERALQGDHDGWMAIGEVPSDMVIYRYVNNELQSWANAFTISSDDISTRVLYQKLADPKNLPSSPLSEVTEKASYMNLGQQWFLMKSRSGSEYEVIGGLMIIDDNAGHSVNSVNPRLGLSDRFSVKPLTFSEGACVSIGGAPQFKVLQETLKPRPEANSFFTVLAVLLFVMSILTYVSVHRSIKLYHISLLLITAAMAMIYSWGAMNPSASSLFSPTLFAGGTVLYSLAAVLIINLYIFYVVGLTYLVRRQIYTSINSSPHRNILLILSSLAVILVVICICSYAHASFTSIIKNSNIGLELYKLNELSVYTAFVFISYMIMMMSVPMLLQFLRPTVKMLTGFHFDAFSAVSSIIFSMLLSVYFVVVSSILGFEKEKNRVDVWANRLSMERDINLELQLRILETPIANDAFIASLSKLPSAGSVVLNRLVDSYMYSLSKDYDISVALYGASETDPARISYFSDRVRNGVKVHNLSRWMYTTTVSGRARYSALFTYYSAEYGPSYMIVGVEPKLNLEYSGYADILGLAAANKVTVPQRYSYARYGDGKIMTYRGNYAYPTVLSDDWLTLTGLSDDENFNYDGFVHFSRRVSDSETVVISRRKETVFNYVVAVISLTLVAYILLSILGLTRVRKPVFENAYFKNRITRMLMASLILTLVGLATVSMFFVYNRNDANMKEMMSEKINTLQAMMSGSCRYVGSYTDLNPQELTSDMAMAARMAKADITLYSPTGKAFRSTASDVFDMMYLSDRMNAKAFREIVYQNKRYVINRERYGKHHYTALYAPLFNEGGDIIAILCSPYTEENYDFKADAVTHAASIIACFLILLMLAKFMVSSIVDKLFEPLIRLGRKMNHTHINSLEIIEYDREDEVSTLVRAYNLMVEDLARSSQAQAQAARDKAWASMARQVAHDIKNPLTPMKLQIQRLIRLKQRNAPGWEEKLDDIAQMLLEHIDILSDTANEFSMIAKLPSESNTVINLDDFLTNEISMFDNKDNIGFSYIGLDGASILAPKPQLTRVVVNLLTNSVQAIEMRQQDETAAGSAPFRGIILVSLRHSMTEGFYDIVFEDNGPGVPPEYQGRLFTPNFTTKSSGSGLGLASCRSILEQCEATISYSKSFSLGGACFTVRYPKM